MEYKKKYDICHTTIQNITHDLNLVSTNVVTLFKPEFIIFQSALNHLFNAVRFFFTFALV